MALITALTHALYIIGMHHHIRDVEVRGKKINIMRLFGVMGGLIIVVLWPGFVVLNWMGWETWELLPSGKIWIVVTVRSSILNHSSNIDINVLMFDLRSKGLLHISSPTPPDIRKSCILICE